MFTKVPTPESSAIASVAFDQKHQRMDVEFKSGSTYRYQGVSTAVFREFVAAKSVGKHFQSQIRPYFEGKFLG